MNKSLYIPVLIIALALVFYVMFLAVDYSVEIVNQSGGSISNVTIQAGAKTEEIQDFRDSTSLRIKLDVDKDTDIKLSITPKDGGPLFTQHFGYLTPGIRAHYTVRIKPDYSLDVRNE